MLPLWFFPISAPTVLTMPSPRIWSGTHRDDASTAMGALHTFMEHTTATTHYTHCTSWVANGKRPTQ